MFQKIALAIAFSPTCKSLLMEASRLKGLLGAKLILIHIGMKTETNEKFLKHLLLESEIIEEETDIFWEEGKPAKQILTICKREKADLIIAGALKRENLFNYYIGTVARKIMRKSACSVLILVNPSESPKPFGEIVIHADDSLFSKHVVKVGTTLARMEKSSQIHLVREIQLYGLAMSITSEGTEKEYSTIRKKMVRDELKRLEQTVDDREGLKINFKILAGKSGFELSNFAKKTHPDLVIVGAKAKRFDLFDRFFTHDLEYIFADLPCNLLVVKPK